MDQKEYYEKGMVKYTSRDYESIMKDFWELVPKLTDLWKPEADADPGVVLGKYLASIADMLGVNLDWLANEMFAPSVSQRSNAEKLFGLIGYTLGWYTAARTEITFTNNTESIMELDFGFNGANFSTVNAYTDITDQARVITYNILPLTNKYGATESRAHRNIISNIFNVFVDSDVVRLNPGESVTRVGVEGELRSYSVSIKQIRQNKNIIKVPSQHIDTTAIWIKAKATQSDDHFMDTQWIQVETPAEFGIPEPRFAVTYDNYSNAQIQVSNYLDQLDNYDDDSFLVVYWLDCSGMIGCVGENVLSNYLQAKSVRKVIDQAAKELTITNLANTLELPHTHTVTGKSPETAKQAYFNSRNYINTWDSLITLPDFTRFLNREPGVDCGVVLDCQKALEINMAIYRDQNLTPSQKRKMYIDNYDFPQGDPEVDWLDKINTDYLNTRTMHKVLPKQKLSDIANIYNITEDELRNYNNLKKDDEVYAGYMLKIPTGVTAPPTPDFVSNFKTYTAMCFAIHDDFAKNSSWGQNQTAPAKIDNRQVFMKYKPPQQFIQAVKQDYRPLQAMTVELDFGYVRVFDFYIVGQIYTKKPISRDVGAAIIAKAKEDLALFFAPANRQIGQKPTVMEVVNTIQKSDSRIDYFDAGSLRNPVINYHKCDVDYFNYISFARLIDIGDNAVNLRIAPECLLD